VLNASDVHLLQFEEYYGNNGATNETISHILALRLHVRYSLTLTPTSRSEVPETDMGDVLSKATGPKKYTLTDCTTEGDRK